MFFHELLFSNEGIEILFSVLMLCCVHAQIDIDIQIKAKINFTK